MPSEDKRWLMVDATMRRHGYAGNCLIESLHTAQEAFGYLDATALRFVAGSLNLPLSKVYGVVTFYHFFALVPPARHRCTVCLGTACYIKGAAVHLEAIEKMRRQLAGGELSIEVARCVGTCGLAPLAIVGDQVIGKLQGSEAVDRIRKLMHHDI